jgi:ribonuclease P protein component
VRVKQTFPKALRLHYKSDFDRIYKAKTAASDWLFIIFILPNNLQTSRLGLSISRKVGNAVVRNRWKRLIREVFRKNHQSFPMPLDLIVIPQRNAKITNEQKMKNSIRKLITKAIKRFS